MIDTVRYGGGAAVVAISLGCLSQSFRMTAIAGILSGLSLSALIEEKKHLNLAEWVSEKSNLNSKELQAIMIVAVPFFANAFLLPSISAGRLTFKEATKYGVIGALSSLASMTLL